MKYTVNKLIERLQELVEKNSKIGEAKVGICVVDEDNDHWMKSAYNLDIDEECFCDDTFYIQECDYREYDDEDDEDEEYY